MPMDYSKYPANWKQISKALREKRGQRCEQCGAANGALILRSSEDSARYMVYDPETDRHYLNGMAVRLSEIPEEFEVGNYTKVVLTVHHVGVPKPDGTPGDPHDKHDVREENLQVLCQRCHLQADMPIHLANRKRTLQRKKAARIAATGQMILLGEDE